jgi:hypothetical protein
MESQVRRDGSVGGHAVKAVEDENRRLQKLLAESLLDNTARKDLRGKNG